MMNSLEFYYSTLSRVSRRNFEQIEANVVKILDKTGLK